MGKFLKFVCSFYKIAQIVYCVGCVAPDFGTRAIVVFFFLNVFGLVLVHLGMMGLACALECMTATVVAIEDPGIVP